MIKHIMITFVWVLAGIAALLITQGMHAPQSATADVITFEDGSRSDGTCQTGALCDDSRFDVFLPSSETKIN